jgi:hypothetical protein
LPTPDDVTHPRARRSDLEPHAAWAATPAQGVPPTPGWLPRPPTNSDRRCVKPNRAPAGRTTMLNVREQHSLPRWYLKRPHGGHRPIVARGMTKMVAANVVAASDIAASGTPPAGLSTGRPSRPMIGGCGVDDRSSLSRIVGRGRRCRA